MRTLTISTFAIAAFAALAAVIPAQAEMNGGGPTQKNGQCFKYSSFFNSQDGRFGYWGQCPQSASATTTTTTRTRRPQVSQR